MAENLFEGRMLESKWKKNFGMSRDVFMILADEVRPIPEPSCGYDFILSEESGVHSYDC